MLHVSGSSVKTIPLLLLLLASSLVRFSDG
jgi:hypothetical protein